MNNTKILDCTLRDGGYYNEWDFAPDVTRSLCSSLNEAGVDIVEVGYKAPPQEGFAGLFRYCPESQLLWLRKYSRLQYAFMVDAREFLTGDLKANRELVRKLIKPRIESLFSWCRIATHYSTVTGAVELVREMRGLGYKVGFNIMGISLLSERQIADTLSDVARADVDVFYFADSFGSLRPEDVLRYIRLIRNEFRGAIGIHTHDNQGLAFANTEAAIATGVEFVDATVMGMGRGAGNLRLEQLLLALYFREKRHELNPFALVDVIEEHFTPLQHLYRWGWDFSYMVSGLQNIHPSYCQKLKSSHQFTLAQVANILREIPAAKRSSFNATDLADVTGRILPGKDAVGSSRSDLPPYQLPTLVSSVLVVGTGPSVHLHGDALRTFIETRKPQVIECNSCGELEQVPRIVAVMNEVRLRELKELGALARVEAVVTGMESVPLELGLPSLCRMPCRLQADTVNLGKGTITIPSFVVGMFAVSLAVMLRPKMIFLAGFDGFSDPTKKSEQEEMEMFWKKLNIASNKPLPEIVSLLPTTYDLPECSIYSMLN